jgi:hypothetical protein
LFPGAAAHGLQQELGISPIEATPSGGLIFLPSPKLGSGAKLRDAAIAALNNGEVRKRLADIGQDPVDASRTTPEYLGRFVKSEIDKWAVPIKASGVKVD